VQSFSHFHRRATGAFGLQQIVTTLLNDCTGDALFVVQGIGGDDCTLQFAVLVKFFGDSQFPIGLVVFAAGLRVGQSNRCERSAVVLAQA